MALRRDNIYRTTRLYCTRLCTPPPPMFFTTTTFITPLRYCARQPSNHRIHCHCVYRVAVLFWLPNNFRQHYNHTQTQTICGVEVLIKSVSPPPPPVTRPTAVIYNNFLGTRSRLFCVLCMCTVCLPPPTGWIPTKCGAAVRRVE